MSQTSRKPLDLLHASERILFEDDDLIAIDKPPGLPCQATLDPKRFHLAQAIENYLHSRNPGSEIYVGQHHRLDLDTSGVMIFTKTKRANAGLAMQFREHVAKKIYWALVAPRLSKNEWIIQNHLSAGKSKPPRMQSVKSGGDRAETFFGNLVSGKTASLVEAKPRTGRRHQIRVHLSESGHPIVGDALYGGMMKASRVMLHAKVLQINHPITGERLTIKSAIPDDFRSEANRLEIALPE